MKEYERDREISLYPEWSLIQGSTNYQNGYWTILKNYIVFGIPNSSLISIRKVILNVADQRNYLLGNDPLFTWKNIETEQNFNTHIDIESIIMELIL